MAETALAPGQDLVDITQDLLNRVYRLEQRITSPSYVVPNGSNPTFTTVTLGTYIDGVSAGTDLIPASSSPTSLTLNTFANFEDVGITGTWVAPVDGSAVEYEFALYIKNVGAGTYSLAQVVRTTALTATITGLIPGATYGGKVLGINRIGVPSATYPVSTYIDQIATPDATIPAAPTGLTAFPGVSSISLSWNDNAEVDVAKGKGLYRVQRATDAAFTLNLDVRLTSSTVISYNGLTAGTLYYFRVLAIDSSGNEGPYTGSVNTTPGGSISSISDGSAPGSSPTPTLTAMIGALDVRWTASANADYTTYEVHLSTTNGFTAGAGTKVGEIDGTRYIATTDNAGTALSYANTYYARLIAKDRDGSAAQSTQSAGVSPRKAAASDMVVGTITAASGIIGDISANTITSGSVSATFITAGTFTSDRIVTAGLDAAVVKFGTMSGDRITANTLDVIALKSSSISAATLTITSTGQIKIGNPGGGGGTFGVLLDTTGIRLYQGTTETVRLDAANGNASFTGTINANAGSFSGSITASGTITGGTFRGGTFDTGSGTTSVVRMDTSGIKAYNASAAETFRVEASTGKVLMAGTISTAISGDRIEIGTGISGAGFGGGGSTPTTEIRFLDTGTGISSSIAGYLAGSATELRIRASNTAIGGYIRLIDDVASAASLYLMVGSPSSTLCGIYLAGNNITVDAGLGALALSGATTINGRAAVDAQNVRNTIVAGALNVSFSASADATTTYTYPTAFSAFMVALATIQSGTAATGGVVRALTTTSVLTLACHATASHSNTWVVSFVTLGQM